MIEICLWNESITVITMKNNNYLLTLSHEKTFKKETNNPDYNLSFDLSMNRSIFVSR